MPKSPEPQPGPVLAPAEGPPLQALSQPSGSFICEMPNCGAVSVSVSSGGLGLGGPDGWLCLALRDTVHFRERALSALAVGQRGFRAAMVLSYVCLFTHSASTYLRSTCSVLSTELCAQGTRSRSLPSGSRKSELLGAGAQGWAGSFGLQNLLSPWCRFPPLGCVTPGHA